MTVFGIQFTPTKVDNGGYWLNTVEVDLAQLVAAYRLYSGKKTIVMGK